MSLIYDSKNFTVEAVDNPLVDRRDGGHIVINPRKRVVDLQALKPPQAIELIRLLMVVGQAMTRILNKNGVDIGRINYQDNGNWGVFKEEGPYQHFHLLGRAKSAVNQKYGQSCHFPHIDDHPEQYASLKPLTAKDVRGIRNEIEQMLAQEEYLDKNWRLYN